jgi:hypothetical protein
MIRKGNVTIGLQTRFGPDWTGIRCGARTKLGGECQRPAVKKTGRCTRHGGKSTGPRTQAGRNKIAALHTTHGKYTKAKRREAQKSAEVGRKVRAEIKLIETCLRCAGSELAQKLVNAITKVTGSLALIKGYFDKS